MSESQVQWTQDKVDWLKIASQTPDPKTEKLPGFSRLAEMATEQFGLEVTRHQIRHAVARFIEGGEEPVKTDSGDGKPPDVALLLRANDTLNTALQKERDKSEIITKAIRDTVSALPPLTPIPLPKSGDEDPHVAMLDVSDVHIGELVDPVLTGGLSEYNFNLFKARGERLLRGVHKIVGIQRKAYPVDVLYVNILGDIVTGEAVYRGQAFQIDMPLLRQIFEGGYFFANILRDFARSYREVHIRAVPGNHGRQKENHPRTNWDVAVYELLKILMVDHKNVDIEISESSWLAYHIPGHERFRHVLTHGDQIKGWGSIPFYGTERTGAAMQSMLGIPLDYFHFGHVHNHADWPSNRLNFEMNGSWVGGSDLSVNKMSRAALPTQNLFMCHPRRGVACIYRIKLEEWPDLQPDDRGIFRPKEKAAK